MNKIILLLIVFLGNIVNTQAQKNKDVLLTIDGKEIYASDFKRVYKKNLELVQDESQKSVDGYLDLFIDYQLKIAEAYAEELDKNRTYKSEFSKYQEQLSRNYLFESRVTDELVKEAYERSLEVIEAAHILVFSKYDDLPQDTLVAYNKIKMVREKAIAGEDFTELANTYSEENSGKNTGGYLGKFSAFQMVYPFESMAYNTKVGEISEIVRTQFGYHIIKVLDRYKKGEDISVSHIMIADKEDASRTFDPKQRIDEIYTMLQQGESFESLVKQYSEDKGSVKNNGKLRKFGRGGVSAKKFEDAAFKLKRVGEISEPIQSKFGWHIIRLDEIHPIPSIEDEREKLEKRVQDENRTKIVTNAINEKIKARYGFENGAPFSGFFNDYVTDSILTKKWKPASFPTKADKVIFTIGDHDVMFSEFAAYIEREQGRMRNTRLKSMMISELYNDFETEELKKYFRKKLEEENEEYAAIISEYRYGLLIFELMEDKVWNLAKEDTTGLENYFKQNESSYLWKQRVNAEIISVVDRQLAKTVQEMLEAGKTMEEIKASMNTDDEVKIIGTKGTFEEGDRLLPSDFTAVKGVSPIYESNGSFVVIKVSEIKAAGPKTLDEVKGKVMSDYQRFLEEQWIESLRKKYNVEVNTKTLKKIKKELES
ncbi:foldase protein PrsA [Constantimarinum furrinae]|uniref:peptidylprolyl isomerase n=1 Tax=Constantimarinum furrinae TaxID=2562285 RepID=A0A7G8PQN3_9FLAO|nr:peptidylprolyl isomerase [Constantimarinum furrinae]QNJ96649.1 peptidyl-prolyl cis-trans isomerase SurA [Constantimarinum furrinae]